MAIQHLRGNCHAPVCERNASAGVHGNMAALLQTLGGIGDAGLCYAQGLGHLHGANVPPALLEDQHRLQVVFGCSVYLHGNLHHPFLGITSRLAHSN